jgi:hypothetical protein
MLVVLSCDTCRETANRFSFQGCAPFAWCGAYPRERGSTSMLDVGEQRKQRHMFIFWCRLKEFGYGDLSFGGRTVGGALLCFRFCYFVR